MEEDLWTNLPQDITIDILGRLSVRSIVRCKCVCKSWRNLIEGGDFATSYTPKPGLAFVHGDMGYTVCDEACHPRFRFRLPPSRDRAHRRVVIDSANGLLLVWDVCANILFIYNPMTREYVELPPLPTLTGSCIFGFGVSKLSGQYQILCVDQSRSCHVHTLGRGRGEGLWRSIPAAPGSPRLPRNNASAFSNSPRVPCDYAAFLNGNLHLLLESDVEKNLLVCCFDLETELFTSFSLPPRDDGGSGYGSHRLCILEGRLCFCHVSESYSVVIWWMNIYGDENSWIEVYTFRQRPLYDIYGLVYPLKVLANGNLLLALGIDDKLFFYCKNSSHTALETYGLLQRPTYYYSNIAMYTLSFLSLKTMGIHNVQSLSFD